MDIHIELISEYGKRLGLTIKEWNIIKEGILPKLFTTEYSLNEEGINICRREIDGFFDNHHIFGPWKRDNTKRDYKRNYLGIFISGVVLTSKIKNNKLP